MTKKKLGTVLEETCFVFNVVVVVVAVVLSCFSSDFCLLMPNVCGD